MRTIRLYDTRSGAPAELRPRDPGRVAIYACGPTVYNRIHVGNGRSFAVFAMFKRFLAHEGYDVTFVANITDVNDKIYDAARPLGVPSADLAREMTAHYVADTDGLGLGRPDHEPLASETIDGIVGLIQALVDGGNAYVAGGDVYFRVRSDPSYGSLSHRTVDDMDQGEGLEGADRKEDPLDFALWKAEKAGEDTSWEAPWGRGRPGWHIECSAMAESLLGVGFDVHGGGNDLFVRHLENEAAQTRAARGEELARIWMHNGMLQLGGEKMAKSAGNIASLADALERWGRDALVLFYASGHYRQPIQYSDETLRDAQAGVRRIREAARRLRPGPSPEDMAGLKERFFAALADDFNTPQALAAAWEWVREANRRTGAGQGDRGSGGGAGGGREAGRGSGAGEAGGGVGDADLREMLDVLGLANLLDAEGGDGAPDAEAVALLERREAARAVRDWGEADRLRDELTARGWQVRDSPAGPELVRAPR